MVAEATQNLVASARGPQEVLAKAANEAVQTLNSQADVVKMGVASLSRENVEEQVKYRCNVLVYKRAHCAHTRTTHTHTHTNTHTNIPDYFAAIFSQILSLSAKSLLQY